jgi:hypothetical protein
MRFLSRRDVLVRVLDSFVGELFCIEFEEIQNELVDPQVPEEILGEPIALAVFIEEVGELSSFL